MGKVGHPSKTLWVVSLLAVGLAIIIVWLLSFFLASPLGLLWRRSDFVRGDFTFSQDRQWLGYRTFGEFVVRRTKDGREVWRKKLPGHFFSFCIPLPSPEIPPSCPLFPKAPPSRRPRRRRCIGNRLSISSKGVAVV
jgi:hypothetical protein